MSVAINSLRLVYPPISNQEAEWFKEDPEVEAVLRRSNLYMITQRPEAKFIWHENKVYGSGIQFAGKGIQFSLSMSGGSTARGVLSVLDDLAVRESVVYELGDKYIRARIGSLDGEVLWWYSTDTLLFSKWRGDPRIGGLENYRDFTKYYLLYVGISNKQDSFDRLLVQGHHKRVAILSNETQLLPQARLTDEIVLFFFASVPLYINTFGLDADFSKLGQGMPFTPEQATADAEKAFTKFLETKYNDIRFKSFPKGKDGLYSSGLLRYAHVVDEDVTFVTEKTYLNGGYGKGLPCSNAADGIVVEGEQAYIARSEELTKGGAI
jgi:hypothetical protein